jgi:hypothetical protein
MKKVYSIMAVAFICTSGLFAQEKVIVAKVDSPPFMDGVGDEADIWGDESLAPKQQMVLNFGAEKENNTCYWQAVHDGTFIYVLLNVEDKVNLLEDPNGIDEDNWHFDRVELFFDMRTDTDDGDGPGDLGPNDPGNGTFRYKAIAKEAQGLNADYVALKMTEANYEVEWKIPFYELEESAGDIVQADGVQEIGFEVIVIDRDIMAVPFGRKVWAINGPLEDAWDNMDNAGHIILSAESGPSAVHSGIAAKPVNIYPNPVQSELTIEFESLYRVSVMSVTGQEVLNVNAANDKMTIDISELDGGVYFIKATNKSGASGTYKIVKQ